MQRRVLTEKKHMRLLFALCWMMYFTSYLGRLNYSAVMSELIGVSLSLEQAGWISTVFLIAYAAGQFISGMLAERIAPYWMIALGLLGGALTNGLFALAPHYPVMLFLRLLTGFFMSMLWPSMMRILATMFGDKDRLRYSVHIGSSIAIGTLCSYLLSAWMLHSFTWRAAFYLPCFLMLAVVAVWLMLFPYLRKQTENTEEIPADAAQETAEKPLPFLELLLAPGIIALFLPAMLHGAIKDGVTAWIPTYISDVFFADPAFTALVLTVLPLINLSGGYIAHFLYNKMQSETRCMTVFFFVAACALGIIATGWTNLAVTIVLFSIITSSMMAVNVLLMNILPLRYQSVGRTATLSGMFNAVAYAGSAIASGLIGLITAAWGWNSAVISWLLCMVLGAIACALLALRNYRR